MGTIFITVHGTGDAARADHGAEPKWWEPESPFAAELLAAAPAGSVVEPFVWSGANDELQRRAAAERLLKRLRAGKGGAPIVLIGHSHGGSVIATALKFAAAKKDSLDHVTRWVTVGTPFIQMRRKWFLWERYNLFGQAVASVLVIIVVGVALSIVSDLRQGYHGNITASLTLFVPGLFVFMLMLALSQRRVRALHANNVLQRNSKLFSARWSGVSSKRDEATASLSRLAKTKLGVFDKTILSAPIRSLVSIAYIILAGLGWLNQQIEATYPGLSFQTGPLRDFVLAMNALLQSGVEMIGFANLVVRLTDAFGAYIGLPIAAVVLTASMVVVTVLPLLLLLFALDRLSRLTIGRFAAGRMNDAVNGALRKKAYGATTVGEKAVGATTSPFEGVAVGALPDDAEAALANYARANAADLLAGVHEELFREDRIGKEDMLAEAILEKLTWRELIHTAYFKVPESRRHIVALAAGVT